MPLSTGTIEITFDTRQMIELLRGFIATNDRAANRALHVVARELLKDSKLYVPVLTGALKDSGRVEEVPTLNDARRVVQTVYGNAQVLYAFIQHERAFNHPSLGFFGPAKYLEKPLLANYTYYQSLFIVEYQLAIGRG